jgi:hypothetical protein
MATELFFKSFLALRGRLSKKEARALSHDLLTIFDRFLAVSEYREWEPIRSLLSSYPPIHARYELVKCPDPQLWQFIALSQSIGSVICREHTDRNMMARVLAMRNDGAMPSGAK